MSISEGKEYRRPAYGALVARLREPRRFIQVVFGPRQSGKTTLARQAMTGLGFPSHYAAADEMGRRGTAWIHEHWEAARAMAAKGGRRGGLLVLDEVQKVEGWSEAVKRLWDEDAASGLALRVLVLGSSPLLVQRGAHESLAGRFEMFPVGHWSLPEMKEAFGCSLERFVFFGGYPKSAELTRDPDRWRRYILESIIETTVSRDILFMARVDKPALLRQLFQAACDHAGQVLSYQKMLGVLQDAGNTVTLAHYLELLRGAGLALGLQKYARRKPVQRGSSPKIVVLNTGLVTASTGLEYEDARKDPALWGRLVENAVGAHLANEAHREGFALTYWRDRDQEVDYVIERGRRIAAIEVKTGLSRKGLPGMESFRRRFNPAKCILVGPEGIPPDEFLSTPASTWLK